LEARRVDYDMVLNHQSRLEVLPVPKFWTH
jgi:hypothetical protein